MAAGVQGCFMIGDFCAVSLFMMHEKTKNRHFSLIDPHNPGMPIVLVGLMGAGKSTIGRRLAARLGLGFVDADDAIAEAAGRSISEIFEAFGEAAFREGERRVIARLIDDKPQVIATGGGAFADPQTRDLVLSRSFSVWLDADIDILVERTAKRDTRPLLRQGDPRTILEGLWKTRAGDYAQANIHIKSSDGPHEHVVDKIIAAMGSYIRERTGP
ncbi:shikimate kinase [Iodidimonas nitroreducens]|uniref:Shikimate kinase n=2 Tax=Iodidimonas nitroreducens TaxID=1236968 RepID=A0A5A7NAL3_9PROT|nr:shikimate kinase [alpha proteobacterium Q-1]GER05421.1 shikimate kinase [Iodidimonas nitroreducens]